MKPDPDQAAIDRPREKRARAAVRSGAPAWLWHALALAPLFGTGFANGWLQQNQDRDTRAPPQQEGVIRFRDAVAAPDHCPKTDGEVTGQPPEFQFSLAWLPAPTTPTTPRLDLHAA